MRLARGSKRVVCGIGSALAAVVLLVLPASAGAVAPDFLLQIPEESIVPGPGADELDNPRAVTGDPVNGHVYVSELNNARISEFTAWGQFVKAWGWDVAPDGAPGDTASDQLEVCTSACKSGVPGNGAGQLNQPRGIALDAGGDLYVHEAAFSTSQRVQKFDTDGNFVLMFGGEVNKTTGEDVCTKADLEASEVCGAGLEGSEDAHFSGTSFNNYIAYNPVTDSVFIGDKDRIQEFDTDGIFLADIDFEGELAAADGRSVGALAVDPVTGDLYFSLEFSAPATEPIYKVSSSGALIDEEFASTEAAPYPGGLATDADGNLYIAIDRYTDTNSATPDSPGEVVSFEADGSPIAGMELGDEFATPPPAGGSVIPPTINGLGTNVLGPGSSEPGDLYVVYFGAAQAAYLNAYGPAPIAFEDPPLRPPVISAQYGVSAGTNEALLRAQINPRFWPDTTFHVEYGTEPCSAGGCEAQTPPVLLSAKSVNKALTTNAMLLEGLEPGTTYHFRFVAQSTGGGPVFGVDPDGEGPLEADEGDGLEGSFRTFAMPATAPDSCPANDDVRIGPSAKLPDCRGYEMVSPLDKGGGDATLKGEKDSPEDISQSALSGGGFAFSAKRAFGDLEGAPFISQYLTDRDPGTGWASDPIAPQRTRLLLALESSAGNEFTHFSEDLCQAWLVQTFEPVLAEGAIVGYPNLYRRENCSGAPSYEALSRPEAPITKPPNRPADKFLMNFLGASADGSHAIFSANGKLTAQGAALPEIEEPQLYEHVKGAANARLVCILPSGTPSTQPCGAGTPAGPAAGSWSNVQGAISDDGQRIFWTSFAPGSFAFLNGESGRIFVRVEGKATTAVSQSVTPENSWFWGASEDGSTAIFEVVEGPLADNLYEFDVDAKAATLIAGDVVGMLGISEDASRIYLASREDLDAGGPATAGDVNLYLREGGDFAFIRALAAADATQSPSPVHKLSRFRGSRLTPDGSHVAFTSSAPLTGYDNTDAVTGQPDTEVFLYDSVQDELRCVSCNPTGIRPTGKADTAAIIPAWERPTYASRLLSDDGQRLFFESHEALVPQDTNAKLDVYQWEAAGKGSCDEEDPNFSEASQGCVELISSGQSTTDSRFLDASPPGDDVFIATLSSLVPQDYGLIDVYDARVGGGFPPPVDPPECEGQACQSPPPPPAFPTPPSSSAAPESKPKKCPKGKRRVVRKGKPRCVKPRKHRKQRKRSARKGANR